MRVEIKGVGTVTFQSKADHDAHPSEGVEHLMTVTQFSAVLTELFHKWGQVQPINPPGGITTNPTPPTDPTTPGTPTGPVIPTKGLGPWHIIQSALKQPSGELLAIVVGVPDEVLKA